MSAWEYWRGSTPGFLVKSRLDLIMFELCRCWPVYYSSRQKVSGVKVIHHYLSRMLNTVRPSISTIFPAICEPPFFLIGGLLSYRPPWEDVPWLPMAAPPRLVQVAQGDVTEPDLVGIRNRTCLLYAFYRHFARLHLEYSILSCYKVHNTMIYYAMQFNIRQYKTIYNTDIQICIYTLCTWCTCVQNITESLKHTKTCGIRSVWMKRLKPSIPVHANNTLSPFCTASWLFALGIPDYCHDPALCHLQNLVVCKCQVENISWFSCGFLVNGIWSQGSSTIQ